MLRTVTFFTKFGLHLVSTIHTSYRYNQLGKAGKAEEQTQFLNEAAIEWGQYLVKRTKSTIDVIGKDNIPEGPCLIISNHQSNFDIPILAGYLDKPIGFIAKKELAKVPIMSKWMERVHCVFIDRDNPRQAIKALATAATSLQQGNSLVIFPEGTRSKSNIMGEFKKGSLRLAEKSGVPILPVTLIDSYKIYEGNNNRIRSAKVQVIIDKPIYMDKLENAQKLELLDTIKSQIQTNLDNAAN
jgi:1-acyl-sn-glycerol-3-phosphate acyltransferase